MEELSYQFSITFDPNCDHEAKAGDGFHSLPSLKQLLKARHDAPSWSH
jgi:hypothetical protein